MRQVPLERDINITIDGPFWVEIVIPEHPFTAMLISRSIGKAARVRDTGSGEPGSRPLFGSGSGSSIHIWPSRQ